MIFGTNIQKTRTKIARFIFHVGLLFFIYFSPFKPDSKTNANFDTVSSKCANFDAVQ